jgi:hypothetical protein
MADLNPTEWSVPVNLGSSINTASSEVQLGIAPNGKSLYVMSNRAGGSGDADIWVSSRQPGGSWGPLVNLGATVNSSALDASPTLSVDGHYLYFASRRPGGLGGLDCWRSYRADPSDDFAWETPENLGPSVNSAFDDADCLPVGNQNANGEFWFTSLNRPDGKGGYDIYKSDIGPTDRSARRAGCRAEYRRTRHSPHAHRQWIDDLLHVEQGRRVGRHRYLDGESKDEEQSILRSR